MRVRSISILWGPLLGLLNACGTSAKSRPDASGAVDASTTVASSDRDPVSEAPDASVAAEDAARSLTADANIVQELDGGGDTEDAETHAADACATPPCGPDACDTDRPCAEPDATCIDRRCAMDPSAPPASFTRSAFSGRVGRVGDDDATLWCTPVPSNAPVDADHPASVNSALVQVSLDGGPAQAGAPHVLQRVQVQCFADVALTGPSLIRTSPWSEAGGAEGVRVDCPRDHPFAAFPRCQLAAEGKPPFAYAGTDCGDGVAGLLAKPELSGQLIGDHVELGGNSTPLFNDTGAQAGVVGSDLGYQFLAQGHMYVGFGDTWENDLMVEGPLGLRGSVLANTRDFDPSDGNGIAFEGWDMQPGKSKAAREVVASPHDQSGDGEFTAIASAGFGLSEQQIGYRFLWFAGVETWTPSFTPTASSIAWSMNGEPFVRGDQDAEFHAPRWPSDSYFGAGAIWVDRERGYVYFFGVRLYAESPVHVARVRAKVAAVRDHLQYEYWTGSDWKTPDPGDEYALSRAPTPAADLLPGSATQNTRPELSVAYNAYAGRLLMLVLNDATPFQNQPETEFQIWQAERPEGPWTLVDTGDKFTLASGLYGPYTSDLLQTEGGRRVWFALSDWNLLPGPLGQPYVVGLWNMQLERKIKPGCTP